MKKQIAIAGIFSLLFIGCASVKPCAEQTPQTLPQAQTNISRKETKPRITKESEPVEVSDKKHVCSAPTKAGGKCTRKIKGDAEFCWQHTKEVSN